MSIWDGFFGGRRQEDDRYARNENTANWAFHGRMGEMGRGADAARGRYQSYVDGGRQGYDAYRNMLGLNGAGAQQAAQGVYQKFNPYLGDQMTAATQALDRRAAATGNFNSGMNALAGARTRADMGTQDLQNYLAHLSGLGNQGYAASGAQAGIDMNEALAKSGIYSDTAGLKMGNSNQYAQGQLGADRGAAQNFLGLAAAAAQAAMGMPPTAMLGAGQGQQVYHAPGTMANMGWETTANRAAGNNNFFNLLGMR